MTASATAAGPPPALDLAFGLQAGGEDAAPDSALVDPVLAEGRWSAHLAAWLGQLQPELPARLQAQGYSLGLELCDDGTIAELNRSWRQKAGPTDVLAFAAQDGAPPLPPPATGDHEAWLELGDIVISLDTARRQAAAAGHPLEQELLFLASHGLLHLLGWDHPDEASLAAMLGRQATLLEACPP